MQTDCVILGGGAGGITSAAVDGVRCAEAVLNAY